MYEIGSIIQRPLKEKGIKRPLSLFYKHVGIYIGVHFNEEKKVDEEQVIHFSTKSSDPESPETIIKTSLDEFKLEDKKVKVTIRAKPEDEDHGRAICEEAEEFYRNPYNEYNYKYRPILKNCEDFAKHCYEVEYNNGQKHAYPKTQLRKTGETVGELAVAGVVILKLLDKGGDDKKNKKA